jgi:hypothetical protein
MGSRLVAGLVIPAGKRGGVRPSAATSLLLPLNGAWANRPSSP